MTVVQPDVGIVTKGRLSLLTAIAAAWLIR
jgi:hypothetical protein